LVCYRPRPVIGSSIDKILEWSSLGREVRRKLFWENATRCFKQT